MDSIEEETLKGCDGRDAFLCIRTENFPCPFVFSCEMLTSSVFRKKRLYTRLVGALPETEDTLPYVHSTQMNPSLLPRSVRPDLEYPTQGYPHMIKPTGSDRADKTLGEQ